MRARRAVIERTGGPEAIGWEDVELAEPEPGEVVMETAAVGLNFIDTYHRSGLYPVPLPSGLGSEAAGRVVAVGEGVALAAGDRVATFGPALGAYATARAVPADQLFRLPDDVDDETAAALLLKGCTAEMLAERCGRVEAGWTVLVHAAAGGVGLILTGWLWALGARVIGTASTAAKREAALAAGADIMLDADDDIAARVRELTHGVGVAVVFDGVGAATWEASLASAARRGLVVSFGNASGPVTGVGLGVLAQRGSLFVTRPTLFDYYREPGERQAGVERLWAMLRAGSIGAEVGQRFALTDAAAAHRALEGRQTTGSTLLIP